MNSPEFSANAIKHFAAWDVEVGGLGLLFDEADDPDKPDEKEDVMQALKNTECLDLEAVRNELRSHCSRLGIVSGQYAYHNLHTPQGEINVAVTPPRELRDVAYRQLKSWLRITVNESEPDPKNEGDTIIRIDDYLIRNGLVSVQHGECKFINYDNANHLVALPFTPPIIWKNETGYYQARSTSDYELAEPKPINKSTTWEELVQQQEILGDLNEILSRLSLGITDEKGEGNV